jgi:glycosyltransferase involved in cell wall biosynthesis
MSPLFSVVVPIYNVEKYIEKCIDSIIKQTYKNFELILVDDGTPDKSGVIADLYAQNDNRVKVIHKENGGLVSARNCGIKNAIGTYICYVDGDDWVDVNLLEKVAFNIERYDPDIVLFGAIKQFENRQEYIDSGAQEGFYSKNNLQETIYPYMIYDDRKRFFKGLIFPVAWNKIYKRDLLLKHYCEDERIKMGEDNAFVYECLYHAKSCYFMNDKLYYYNQMNIDSMVHSYDSNRFINNEYLCEYISKRFTGADQRIYYQINAFRAYWLMMAVFHEVKAKRGLESSVQHLCEYIPGNKDLEIVDSSSIPNIAKLYIKLLRGQHFFFLMVITCLINYFREIRK